MMTNFHHLSIDYTEGVPGSYRGVVLKSPDEQEMRWMTGDPVADWAAYIEHTKELRELIISNSSLTHFCWDNIEYRFVEDDEGREILVPEDRPAWLNSLSEF